MCPFFFIRTRFWVGKERRNFGQNIYPRKFIMTPSICRNFPAPHTGPKVKHLSAKCPPSDHQLSAILGVSKSWRTFGGHMADRCGQLWFLGVSLSWRTFGGHMADRCGQLWFLGVSLSCRTFDGPMADNCFTFEPNSSLYPACFIP